MATSGENVYGPAMAAIWTPKRVIVASCGGKIHAADTVYFALSGLCAGGDFDAAEIIREALGGAGTFRKKLPYAIGALEDPLLAAAQHVQDTAPEEFKKRLAGKAALEVFFVTQHGGDVDLSHLTFRTKRRGKGVALELQQKDYPNAATSIMSVELVAAGIGDSIAKDFSGKTPQQEALVYPERALKKFMGLVEAQEPGNAAYPVNFVKLAAEGAVQGTLPADA